MYFIKHLGTTTENMKVTAICYFHCEMDSREEKIP